MGSVVIPIKRRKHPDVAAIVDEEDADLVAQYPWRVTVRPTANTSRTYVLGKMKDDAGVERTIAMHRLIMGVLNSPQVLVDHINHDGLDNRRSNLRICTNTQNCGNQRRHFGSSRFRGATWNKTVRKWQASIWYDGQPHYLGVFSEEEDAARAWDAQASIHFGEFALLNLGGELL